VPRLNLPLPPHPTTSCSCQSKWRLLNHQVCPLHPLDRIFSRSLRCRYLELPSRSSAATCTASIIESFALSRADFKLTRSSTSKLYPSKVQTLTSSILYLPGSRRHSYSFGTYNHFCGIDKHFTAYRSNSPDDARDQEKFQRK
jgi:hypothetical protein